MSYDKIHSRMHQIATFIFFSRSSMLALAFSPHEGLEVKVSNPPLAFGAGFSKVNYYFIEMETFKIERNR